MNAAPADGKTYPTWNDLLRKVDWSALVPGAIEPVGYTDRALYMAVLLNTQIDAYQRALARLNQPVTNPAVALGNLDEIEACEATAQTITEMFLRAAYAHPGPMS
jgi:hypothetical protein